VNGGKMKNNDEVNVDFDNSFDYKTTIRAAMKKFGGH